MAEDELVSYNIDLSKATANVLGLGDAVEKLAGQIVKFKSVSGVVDKIGEALSLSLKGTTKSGEQVRVKLKEIIEDITNDLGKIVGKARTGKFEVDTVKIDKARKTIQEMGPELKALLAGYIKLGQVNLDNLKPDAKKVEVPKVETLIAKAAKAPTVEQIRAGGPQLGVKAGLEAQFGLTPAIFAQASQVQVDQYTTKLNTLLLSMKGMESETKRIAEITKAYHAGTNPLLDTQDKAILRNLRDLASFSTELGKASQLTSTLRQRAALAKDVLAKQIEPALTDPKIARAVQASFSFFKIPQPEIFADVASPKEKANVKKISDQIRELIVNNADITKKEVDKAISAIGHPGIIDNLKGPVRELVTLIEQLDQAYERLGSEALAATIKQEAASKRTVAAVAQTRNQIEQDAAEQAHRKVIASATVFNATRGQVIPDIIPPEAKARLDIYNSNLLSVQNTAARTELSVEEIGQVFQAVASRDVRGLVGEQQALYSTVVTLNTAYDKLIQKIDAIKKAEAALAAAKLANDQKAIAAAQKSLATQRLGATTRAGLPSVADVLGAVPDFQGRAALVQKYQNALEGVENTIVSVGATEATLAQAHKSILDPDQTITADAQRVRNALLAVNNIFEKIFAASSKVAAKDQADTDKKVANAKKVEDALKAEAKRIADVGVSNAEATAAITSIFNVDLSALEPKLAARISKALGNVIKQYRASGADKIQLSDLISEATKPIGKRALVSPIADLDPLFRSITNVSDIFNEVDDKIKRVGLTAVQVLRGEFVQAALKAGLSIDQVKDAFVKLSVGVKNIPVSPDIESAGLKLLAESKKVGIAFKDEKDLLAASLIEETRILTEQRDKQTRKDIETENKAVARRAKTLAKTQSDNAALLAERKKSFGGVETTLTKGDPALGRQFDFKQSFSASKDSLIALNAAMQAVNNQFVRSGISAKDFEVLVKRTRDSLKPGGSVFTEPLSPQFEKLSKLIISVDEAMDRAGKSGSTAGKSILLSWQGIFRLFQAQVIHTALGQIIGDFRQSLTAVGDFQKEIGLIKTLVQDLPDTFDQWSESIARVANEFGKSPTEVATAAYDALSSQITTTRQETEEFVRIASQLARTTGSTTPDAIKVLSAAINGFNKSSQDAGDLAAKFFTIVDKGNVRLSDINTNFGRTTALARSLGVSFEEVGAALIVLTQTGLSSSQAQTQLNAVLSKLTKPTDAFKEAGFGSGEQLVRTKRLAGVFQTFFKLFKDGNREVVDFFNELRSEQGILTLTEDNADKVVKALEAINDAAGKAKFEQADVEVRSPAGVEFARQVQVMREVVTKDLAGAAVEGINKLTKAFGGLDTIAKSAAQTVINAFTRMGDSIRIAVGLFATLASARTIIYVLSFNIKTLIDATVAFTLVTEVATAKIAAFGVASKAALLANPVVATVAAIAAVSYGIATLVRRSQEVGQEQAKAFEAGKEAAIAAANKISQVYNDAFRKIGDDIKVALDRQIGLFSGWYDNVARNVNKAGDLLEEFGKDIKSALDVSFSGVTDSFKEGIKDVEEIQKKAEKNIENIQKFRRDLFLEGERKDFQQQLQAAPDAQKFPLAAQRSKVLFARAGELFDQGKTEEGLKLIHEATEALDDFRDKFREIERLNKQVNAAQLIRGVQTQARNLLPTNLGIEMNAAFKALNEARLESVGRPASDRVSKALDAVNRLAVQQARAQQRGAIPGAGELAARLKMQSLLNQTLGNENNVIRDTFELRRQALILTEYQEAKEREIEGVAKQQKQTLIENQREAQNLFDELSKISLIDPKTGKALDFEERNKKIARAEELQEKLNDSVTKGFALAAEAKGEPISPEDILKRLQIGDLLNKFRTNLADQAKNKDQIEGVTKAQQQHTGEIVKGQESTAKLVSENEKYIKSLNASIGILKKITEEIEKQVELESDTVLGVEAIPGGKFPAEDVKAFRDALAALNEELNKPTVNVTNLFVALERFKQIANAGPFKNLATSMANVIGDPSQGNKTIVDFLTKATIEAYNLNQALHEQITLKKVIIDTGAALTANVLPKPGDGVVVIDNAKNAFIEYIDVWTEGTQLISRDAVKILGNIERIKSETMKRTTPDLQFPGAFPAPAQAAPAPEVKLQETKEVQIKPFLPPPELPTQPVVREPEFKKLQDDLNQRGPIIIRGAPGDRGGFDLFDRPKVRAINPPVDPNIRGGMIHNLQIIKDVIDGLDKPIQDLLGDFISFNQQTTNLPVNTQLAQTITETNEVSTAFSTLGSTAVSNIQAIASAVSSLNQQLGGMRQNLGGFQAPDTATQAAAMGGWIHYAGGGLVPVMTTPGEVFISPALARKYGQQLKNANYYNSGGFTPRGTDTQPGYLPAGSFVLRKAVANAMFGNGNKSWYIDQPANLRAIFAEGGGHIGFTPTVSPRSFGKMDNSSTMNKTLNSTMHINVNGGTTNQLTAQEIGKALQRQVRLGLLKF